MSITIMKTSGRNGRRQFKNGRAFDASAADFGGN